MRRNLQEVSQQFYLDTDLNYYIGRAYKKYVIKMIEEGEGYFETKTPLDLVADESDIDISALTPMFYQVSMLWRMTSTGKYPLFEKETRFVPVSTVYAAAGDAYRPTWKLQGMNIVLEPTPQSSETGVITPPSSGSGLQLDYNYLPDFPVAASLDSFTFSDNFPTIYEPLIELDATIGAFDAKEGSGGVSSVETFRDERAAWEAKLEISLQRSEFPDRVQYSGTDYTNTTNWRYN